MLRIKIIEAFSGQLWKAGVDKGSIKLRRGGFVREVSVELLH